MVQNIESFQVDVIKVTVKDKPNLAVEPTEESLRKAFQALRKHAELERHIRQLRSKITERNSHRKLKYYFHIWYNRATTAKNISGRTKAEINMSNEKKIELLVSAIAKKQKEISMEQQINDQEKPSSGTMGGSSMPNSNKVQTLSKKPKVTAGPTNFVHVQGKLARSRLEAQKVIIQEQKAKLAEQYKYIQYMKMKQIDKEAKQMNKQTINVVKQALNNCDQQTRRSLVYLMKNEGCRDKSITEIPRIPSPPRFLLRMEARAEARKQRIKQTNEIRQRQREEQKKREEISRRETEEEERNKQLQAFKQAKKLRKEQEDRRLKEIEKNKQLEFTADHFYNKYLFRRYVLKPLTSLMEEKHKCFKKAQQHYQNVLLIKIFSAWKNEWIDNEMNRSQLANKLYSYNLLWYGFNGWKNSTLDIKQKYEAAVEFYDLKLQAKFMKSWHLLCIKIKKTMHEKEEKAKKYYEKHLKKVIFNIWKQYMLVVNDIKERELRRDKWRDLIKKLVLDTPKLSKNSLTC